MSSWSLLKEKGSSTLVVGVGVVVVVQEEAMVAVL